MWHGEKSVAKYINIIKYYIWFNYSHSINVMLGKLCFKFVCTVINNKIEVVLKLL